MDVSSTRPPDVSPPARSAPPEAVVRSVPVEDADAGPTALAAPQPRYATHAWLRSGRRNLPGVLALHDGRLSFTGSGQVLFDDRADTSDVDFPWYRFGGELRITAGGRSHRVSLTPPHSLTDSGDEVVERADGRRAGRIWRTLLDA